MNDKSWKSMRLWAILLLLLILPVVGLADAKEDTSVFIDPVTIVAPATTSSTEDESIEYWNEGAYKKFPKDKKPLSNEVKENIQNEYHRVQSTYNTEDFIYTEERYEGTTFWDRVEKWISDFFSSVTPDVDFTLSKVFVYILYALGGVAVLYTIYRLVFNKQRQFMRAPKEAKEGSVEFVERNLETVDIESYIEQAKREENWNLAIRFLQLQNIKALAKKDYIEWDYRKTNQDLIYEIKDPKVREGLEKTTHVFNYVWYGNFTIDKERFMALEADFLNFKKEIA